MNLEELQQQEKGLREQLANAKEALRACVASQRKIIRRLRDRVNVCQYGICTTPTSPRRELINIGKFYSLCDKHREQLSQTRAK